MASTTFKTVAVITGASGTIGRAITARLLAHDSVIVAASRSITRLEQMVRDFPEARKRIVIREADVRNVEETRDLIQFAIGEFGRLDLLVNGAGSYGSIGLVRDVPPIEWKNAIETNLYGTYNCCYFALRYMMPAKSGCIINIAGGGSTGPLENLSSYAVSKAGIVRLTDSIAQEVRAISIRANAILPGAVDSPMQDQLLLAKDKAGPWYEKIKTLRDSGSGGISAAPTGELVDFLAFGAGKDLTGKLISARYDRFQSWTADEVRKIASSEMFSLRRLDSSTLKPIASDFKLLDL